MDELLRSGLEPPGWTPPRCGCWCRSPDERSAAAPLGRCLEEEMSDPCGGNLGETTRTKKGEEDRNVNGEGETERGWTGEKWNLRLSYFQLRNDLLNHAAAISNLSYCDERPSGSTDLHKCLNVPGIFKIQETVKKTEFMYFPSSKSSLFLPRFFSLSCC